jgi:hypothetical protein
LVRKKSSKRGEATSKPAPKTAKHSTAEKVRSDVRRGDPKPISDTLRPDEPVLGTLTSEEQGWLTTALSHLNRIYENREAGRPGNSAFCIFQVGKVYVQFLARWDAAELVCEAVSEKSVPEVAGILGAAGDKVLRTLGFVPPEISPIYSQEIKIKGVADLGYVTTHPLRRYDSGVAR